MLRAVQEIKPKYVIAENVFGITNIDGGLVFEQVCIDLEIEGYEVQPFIIPAASKNAPHRRDRVWFVANRNNNGSITTKDRQSVDKGNDSNEKRQNETSKFKRYSTTNAANATNSQRKRLEGHDWKWKRFSINRSNERVFVRSKNKFVFTNTHGNGFQQCNGNDEIEPSERRINAQRDIKQGDVNGNATNSDSCRQQTLNNKKRFLEQENKSETFSGNSFKSIYREEGWQNFPTQSPICGGDDGLPTELDGITFSKWRAESIKGYGNAIVPQVAFEIFQVIEKINCNLSK